MSCCYKISQNSDSNPVILWFNDAKMQFELVFNFLADHSTVQVVLRSSYPSNHGFVHVPTDSDRVSFLYL